MTGGQVRPLMVAGVAGGVGTSTWARILRMASPGLELREYQLGRGEQPWQGLVDVLVTSITAASTSKLGDALRVCPRPPILVVMHTVPGVIRESRSHLRKAEPHVTARFDIEYQRMWPQLADAPGGLPLSRTKDIVTALEQFPQALQAMYLPARPAVPGRPGHLARASPLQQPPVNPRAGPPAQQRWGPPPGGDRPIVHRGSQGG